MQLKVIESEKNSIESEFSIEMSERALFRMQNPGYLIYLLLPILPIK